MQSAIIEKLIDHFNRLPGIGPKTAERLVYSLIKRPRADLEDFANVLAQLKDSIRFCETCHQASEQNPCRICRDASRDRSVLCVVSESPDVSAIERTNTFRGIYHVLGGVLNQIEGTGPEQLTIPHLLRRITEEPIAEIILATNPDIEGESTALYLVNLLKPYHIKITRLARGLPMGANVEYADEVTLGNAVSGRREI